MTRIAFYEGWLAGLLLFGAQIPAWAQTISGSTPETAVTTGIVGVTSGQTAQLNVLNLQPVIPGVTAVACPATLEFYDATGALLKQLALSNISPANAASLAFKPVTPSAAANARAQIRAVVVTPATSAMNPFSRPTLTAIPVNIGCSVMASLEIIDDSTGDTSTFTTDLRSMPSYVPVAQPAAQ